MGINRLSLSARSQIIDVTELCSFEWYQEPASCKAYLEVSNATGDFTEGETIQGQSSGATATVFSSYVDGGRVYVENVSGSFQEEETIQGQSSGQTATVDGFTEERSYPDNITGGIFPNSLLSEDINDYLEFESARNGAGTSSILKIEVPENGNYILVPVLGVGSQVDTNVCSRRVYLRAREIGYSPLFLVGSHSYDCLFSTYYSGALGPVQLFPENLSGEFMFVNFQQQDKGVFRWRIHNIRVLKLLI